MRKNVVSKLSKIADGVKRHEEAIEQNFPTKTVALVKYRVGAENGTMHEAKAVAKKFGVSPSWVLQAQKQVQDFIKEMDKDVKKSTPRKSKSKEATAELFCKGVIDLKSETFTVEVADPKMEKDMQALLTEVLTDAKSRRLREFMNKETVRLKSDADSKTAWAWGWGASAVISTILSFAPNLEFHHEWLQLWGGFSALVALIKWHNAVKLNSERKGLLKVRSY